MSEIFEGATNHQSWLSSIRNACDQNLKLPFAVDPRLKLRVFPFESLETLAQIAGQIFYVALNATRRN